MGVRVQIWGKWGTERQYMTEVVHRNSSRCRKTCTRWQETCCYCRQALWEKDSIVCLSNLPIVILTRNNSVDLAQNLCHSVPLTHLHKFFSELCKWLWHLPKKKKKKKSLISVSLQLDNFFLCSDPIPRQQQWNVTIMTHRDVSVSSVQTTNKTCFNTTGLDTLHLCCLHSRVYRLQTSKNDFYQN